MKIMIKNFKGIKEANFEIPENGLVTITGETGFGKTSICQAIRCGTIATWKLYPSMTKDVGKMAINRLAMARAVQESKPLESECIIIDDKIDVSVSWSEQSVSGEGHQGDQELAPYIVGYKSICEAGIDDKSYILSKAFNLNPTKDELLKALPTIPEPKVSSVWNDIERIGWDGAYDSLASQGKTLKQNWRSVTGENYGSQKGNAYFPDGWTHEMKDLSIASLREDADVANSWYEQCLKLQGASEEQIEQLEELALTIDDVKNDFSVLSDNKIKLSKKAMEFTRKIEALPKLNQKSSYCCPKCNTELMVKNEKLVEFKPLSKKEADQIKLLHTQLQEVNDEIKILDIEISDNRSKMKMATEAKEKLASVKLSEKGAEQKIAQAKESWDNCLKRISAFEKKKQADKIHNEISELVVIVTQLANNGLRQSVLKSKLKRFNDLLEKISPNIPTRISEELEFFVNGTPYFFASNGQKQYLQGVIQIAMAHITKFPLVVIDCDKMDDRYYGELKTIGERAKFHVLIAGFGLPDHTHFIVNDDTGMNGVLKEVTHG